MSEQQIEICCERYIADFDAREMKFVRSKKLINTEKSNIMRFFYQNRVFKLFCSYKSLIIIAFCVLGFLTSPFLSR